MGCFTMFYFVHTFGPKLVAFIATIRKAFTIFLSIVLFSHPMNSYHAIGLLLILIVIL